MVFILITGPARSGKSEFAETLASQSDRPVTYIATSCIDGDDREWRERIEIHRRRRPPQWETREVPVELAAAIAAVESSRCVLVDSLGTWVANTLDREDRDWNALCTNLRDRLLQTPATVIVVAEETAWGVVPAYPIGRKFRDRLGTLVRQLGSMANATYLVVAGHALNLTQLGFPLNDQYGKP